MKYEGQICRAPMERASYMLPVAVGCAYNACRFCMLFKHLTYRQLPVEQIEQELIRVRNLGGNPKRVFLGDGNAFGMDTDHLLEIIALVHHHFPAVKSINMDATVTNISQKTDRQLHALQESGVDCLYLGIESGLDDVLHQMHKDHTLAQAYAQIRRMQEAGLQYSAHIMTGVAGKGRGQENAEKTAEFLNRTGPVSVTNFSMFLHSGAPLYEDIKAGIFTPSDVLECLQEERRLIELLDVPNLVYDGFQDVIAFRVKGTLPADRSKMLHRLDEAIETYREKPPVYAYVDDEGGGFFAQQGCSGQMMMQFCDTPPA